MNFLFFLAVLGVELSLVLANQALYYMSPFCLVFLLKGLTSCLGQTRLHHWNDRHAPLLPAFIS
jgi:hypothetical protein